MSSRSFSMVGFLLALALMSACVGQNGANTAAVNVADYGVAGDGRTDDTAALQAAINEATSGDTVFIPDGVYTITRSIVLKPDIKITGESQNHTIIQFGGESTSSMMSLSGVSNVEVRSLTLDGAMQDVTNGIFGERGIGHKLHKLTIKNLAHTGFGPHGILFTGNSQWTDAITHSVISDNTFINIGVDSEWGAAVRLANGSSHNRLVRNIIKDTGRGGILANEGSTNLVIRENHITGIGKTYGGLSIEVHTECNRALIEDNVVEHWISVDQTNHSAIRRNRISTSKLEDWKFAALELAGGTNNIFTDNVAEGGSKIGISISKNYPKEYIFWGRNTLKHMADWGAQLQGGSVGLSYHYFYQNEFSGTHKNHDQSTYPDQGHGFRVNGNSHHITLEGNTIKDNEGLGIEFNGADIDQFSVIGNAITGNKGASVNSYPGDDLQWSDNQVSENGSDTIPTSSGLAHDSITVARFSSDSTAEVNVPIRFTNSSLSKESVGAITHVLWDFDDGLPSTETNPTYTYREAGTYTVTLIVWDDKGRAARTEKTITVVSGSNSSV